MIRTIDEILEKSEENRITRELDECITEMLQPNARKVEEISQEELDNLQREWIEMLAAANFKSRLIPKSEEVVCTLIRPSKCWGLSPKLENLNLTGAAGGIGSEEK